jgi:putative membrane protein
MTKLGKLIIIFLINGLSLYVASRLIPGFRVSLEPRMLAETAGLLTLINLIIKPILRIILTPIIWITFGLASFVLNAFFLYATSRLTQGFNIADVQSLLLATLVVSLTNILCERLLLRKS